MYLKREPIKRLCCNSLQCQAVPSWHRRRASSTQPECRRHHPVDLDVQSTHFFQCKEKPIAYQSCLRIQAKLQLIAYQLCLPRIKAKVKPIEYRLCLQLQAKVQPIAYQPCLHIQTKFKPIEYQLRLPHIEVQSPHSFQVKEKPIAYQLCPLLLQQASRGLSVNVVLGSWSVQSPKPAPKVACKVTMIGDQGPKKFPLSGQRLLHRRGHHRARPFPRVSLQEVRCL